MPGNNWLNSVKNNLARNWFILADEELLYAKAGFRETTNYRYVCFDCQQIAEKYLKGYSQFSDIPFPKTHNLIELLSLMAHADKNFLNFTDKCKILDRYYIETRYPGGSIEIFSKKQAAEALEIAEEIIGFIALKVKGVI